MKPAHEWIKLNVNGAVKTNPGMAAASGLIRDDMGRWLEGFVYNIRVTISIRVEV